MDLRIERARCPSLRLDTGRAGLHDLVRDLLLRVAHHLHGAALPPREGWHVPLHGGFPAARLFVRDGGRLDVRGAVQLHHQRRVRLLLHSRLDRVPAHAHQRRPLLHPAQEVMAPTPSPSMGAGHGAPLRTAAPHPDPRGPHGPHGSRGPHIGTPLSPWKSDLKITGGFYNRRKIVWNVICSSGFGKVA